MFFRSISIIFFFSSSFFTANAQSKITGQVANRKAEPLPFANVLLLNATDSAFIQGVVAQPDGRFQIENIRTGSYRIVSTLVGYQKTYGNVFQIGEGDVLSQDLTLDEQSVELNEVLVEAEKPMFEQQLDKLVVNVQNSITSAGNTALEVLQKSPGIVINRQNNTIIMNGKSGVRVMMNGKMMQLPIDAVVQMLDGMSASNIEKIELITTPPARYDAEGDAGIVHIVLKESADFGTSGSVGAMIGYRWAEGYGMNFNINHRRKKAAYFLDYSMTSNRNMHIWEMGRESQSPDGSFVQTVNDTSIRKNLTVVHNVRAGAEWKIGQRSALHILTTAYSNKWTLNAVTDNHNVQDPVTTVFTRMNIYELNHWQSATGGLRWLTTLNDESDFSVDVDYLHYRNNNPSHYRNTITSTSAPEEEELIDAKKSTPLTFLIGKLDYSYHPAKPFGFEAGVKGVSSQLDNDVTVDFTIDDEKFQHPLFTSFAHLDEWIGAAYISGKYQGKKGIQMNAGLRYEYTSTSITTPDQGQVLDRKYGYFFPSMFVQKDLMKQRDIQLSYSRRITRPTFRDIAPFVFFWNPSTFSAGNTSLWPAISDAFKASFHNKAWILAAQFNHSRHEISFFQPTMDEETNTLILRSENLRYLNSFSLSNSYSFSMARWWEVQTNFTMQYQQAQTEHLENNTSIEVYNFNVNIVNAIKLPNDFSVEVSGYYNSAQVMGISEFQPLGALNVGIQKKFKSNSSLRLSVDDMFHTNVWRVNTNLDQLNFNSKISYDFHMQFIRLSYTYNFGNKKLKSVNIQTGSEEERRRVN